MFHSGRPHLKRRGDSRKAASTWINRGYMATRETGWRGVGRSQPLAWCLSCLLICFPVLLAGQKPSTVRAGQTEPEAQAQIEQGQTLFRSSCAFCHGPDGKGASGPDLLRSPLLNHDVNGELIGQVIHNGRVDKGMPSFAAMKSDQIGEIAAFLHHQARLALRSNRLERDYSLARMMTGNAVEGKAFFDGAGGCAQCHSVTGDLADVGKKYLPIELERKMVYPNSSSVTTTAVVTWNGQRFEGKLVDQDEFNIGIICPDGWYRSWPTEAVQVEIHDPLAAHRQLLLKYTDADLHNVFAYLESLK